MNIDQAIQHFGSISKLARALGVAQSTAHEWIQNGIPEGRQYQIELATGGKLLADTPACRVESCQEAA